MMARKGRVTLQNQSYNTRPLWRDSNAPALRRIGPQAQTIPTCKNEAEILLLFSVLIIIIIIEYISIIY